MLRSITSYKKVILLYDAWMTSRWLGKYVKIMSFLYDFYL